MLAFKWNQAKKVAVMFVSSSLVAWTLIANIGYAGTIRVPSGTSVPVEVTQKVSSKTQNTGDAFKAKVTTDVTVSGVTVIKAGTPVVGIVESVKQKGAVGQPASITIALKSTQAVDGATIALSGTKGAEGSNKTASSVGITALCCILGLLQHGGDAEIASGTQISAQTAQETTITVP